jgi:sterol desaturase/sphingolipid hydroxylase (fatty acid hydroxylase superfamily)
MPSMAAHEQGGQGDMALAESRASALIKKQTLRKPDTWQVLLKAARHHARTAMQLTIVTRLVWPIWSRAVERLKARGASDRLLFTVAIVICHSGLYWPINLLLEHWRNTGKMNRYLLERPSSAPPPSRQLLRKCITEALASQFVSLPLALWFIGFRVFNRMGMPSFSSPRPGVLKIFWSYALSDILNAWLFYFAHRAFHEIPGAYKLFHKQHHEFRSTIGFAAEYAHPVESLVANFFPTIAGCLLFGRHPFILVIWLGERLRETYEGHSGFCFKGSWLDKLGLSHWEGTCYHDHHHTVNIGNYAAAYIDHLFGTDANWVANGGLEGYLEKRAKALNQCSSSS